MAAKQQKIGAFICAGCGIGEALDLDALTAVATGDGGATQC